MSADDLPPHDHAVRRDRLRGELADHGIALLLVTDPVNVRYLTGFTGTYGRLLLAGDAGDDRLITDGRYTRRAAEQAPDLPAVLARDPVPTVIDALDGATPAADGGGLGVEADHLTWAQAYGLEERIHPAGHHLVATEHLIGAQREVKDPAEIARLTRACAITQEALAWLVAEVVAPGRTERELATALERRFVDTGADGVAFPSIVAGGPNGATPHHEPGERPLARGELLTVDCGALVDGYHADHTRTVGLGRVGDHLVSVHALVERAQAAGRAAVVAGATTGQVDAAARDVIDAAGYRESFVHGTGHGVGLEIHEAPGVAEGSADTLRAGTALTVEPGIYLPGTGGVRIEDTLVVTADGPARPLTDTPRELLVV